MRFFLCLFSIVWTGAVFAQANQTLSNLTAPTAINTNLLLNADGTLAVGSSTAALSNVYTYSVNGGPTSSLYVQAQNVSSGPGYDTLLVAGNTSDPSTTSAGGYAIVTAGSSTNGVGGIVAIQAGQGASGSMDGFVQIAGHLENTAPRMGPAASACGTSPSVSGTDVVGHATVGTGGTATCTLTFETPWANPPVCVVSDETARVALKVVPTTTTVTISAAANFAAGTILDYMCQGYR